MIFRVILLGMASLFLGAHFLRAGNPVLTLLCLGMPFLLLIKKRWSWLLVQILVYLGAGIWAHTTLDLVRKRMAMGLPWIKPAIILGAITIFTALSGLVLNTAKVKGKYFS